jgi:hypothetical protein
MVISSRKQRTVSMFSLYLHILAVVPSGQIKEASAYRLRDRKKRSVSGAVRGNTGYRERYLTVIGSSDRLFLLLYAD